MREYFFLQKYEHQTPGKVLAKYASPSQSDPSQATLFLKREILLMRQCYKSGLDFHIFKQKSVICCASSQCNAGREEEVSVAQIVRASKTVSVLCIHSSIHCVSYYTVLHCSNVVRQGTSKAVAGTL